MDELSAAALAEGLKAIGAGLAMLGAIGAGAGIGILVGGAVPVSYTHLDVYKRQVQCTGSSARRRRNSACCTSRLP